MTQPLLASAIASDFSVSILGLDFEVRSISPIDEAKSNSLSFVTDPTKYQQELMAAIASGAAVFVPLDAGSINQGSGCVIPVENPRAAFASTVARYFAPQVRPGVSETARIHPTAQVHPTAYIGEYTVIREGAQIGAHSEVRDHVVIGHRVQIGTHALIKSHAVIGEEGFGIEKDSDGNNLRIPHLGSVRLGDHVEIGGFTTVCSGTILPTTIGDYSKIDDHVHIAHNCRIGKNVIVTACAEVSGSVVLEDRVWLGPNTSIIQGVTLGEDSLLGIGAVALKSIPDNEVRVGNPARRLGENKK